METKVINLIDMVNQSIERKARENWDQDAMIRMVMSDPIHHARVQARREELARTREEQRRKEEIVFFARKVGAVCGLCLVAIGLVVIGTIL